MFGFGSDKMDFRNVHKLVQKEFDNFEFKVKSQDDDRLELNANITAANYFDDDILVKVVVYKGGTTHVFLTFDKLDESQYIETNIIMRDILIEYLDRMY